MFPIGDIAKPEVRKIAEEAGLATAKKKIQQEFASLGNVISKNF